MQGIQVDPGTSQFRRLWATSTERMISTNMTRLDLSHSCRLERSRPNPAPKGPPRHPRNWAHIPRARSGPRNVRYGSEADIGTPHRDVRLVPCVDGSWLASQNFTLRRWSVQPCVRPVSAVRMTAGHNALRGSGPGQKPAFDDALAHVGCPDRRIDRLCITCCSPPNLHITPGDRRDLVHAASATGSL